LGRIGDPQAAQHLGRDAERPQARHGVMAHAGQQDFVRLIPRDHGSQRPPQSNRAA